MTVDLLLVTVLTVMFLASLVRSTFGFGEALVGMPLLTMLLGINVASPLIALTSTTIAAAILIQDWRQVRFASTWRLVLAALCGIPIGAYVLTELPETAVKIALAVLVIGFALYKLTQPRGFTIRHDWWSYLFGVFAGILGGAYNTQGPPLVIYGTFRGWSPEKFRATLQGFFFPTGLAIIGWHWIHGRVTTNVMWLYTAALPIMLASFLLGHWLHRRIADERFAKYVYILLIVIGVSLLANSITEAIRS